MKIILSKLGLSRGFAFITTLDHVRTELIKIKWNTLVKLKRTNSSPSDKKKAATKSYQKHIEGILVVPGEKR